MSMKKLALLTFYALLISLPTSELSAQSGTRPFGGRILGSPIYCTCSIWHVVNVGPPRPGRFHFVPGATRLYAFMNVYTPGRWIRVSHNSCIQVPNDGVMTIVGTS